MAKRRGQGEGSIYRRGDGRWVAAVSLPGRKRKALYGRTYEEVREKLLKARHDLQQGLPLSGNRQTLGTFLRTWLDDHKKPILAHKTFISYDSILRNHLLPEVGNVRLAKLNPQHIDRYLAKKRREGLAEKYLQQHFAILRHSLNQAVKWGYIGRNPAALVTAPKPRPYKIKPLTGVDVEKLLAAATGSRLEAMYVVALCTGLRRGEILGLRWQDIDFEEKIIRPSYQLQRINNEGLRLFDLKTEESKRPIAMPEFVAAALKRRKTGQKEERLFAGSKWQETIPGLVFTTSIGTPIDPDHLVHRDFKQTLKRAGLPHSVRFHDLRHSCATFLASKGVHLKTIQETLRHSRYQTTADIYTHVIAEMKRDAANKWDEFLGVREA